MALLAPGWTPHLVPSAPPIFCLISLARSIFYILQLFCWRNRRSTMGGCIFEGISHGGDDITSDTTKTAALCLEMCEKYPSREYGVYKPNTKSCTSNSKVFPLLRKINPILVARTYIQPQTWGLHYWWSGTAMWLCRQRKKFALTYVKCIWYVMQHRTLIHSSGSDSAPNTARAYRCMPRQVWSIINTIRQDISVSFLACQHIRLLFDFCRFGCIWVTITAVSGFSHKKRLLGSFQILIKEVRKRKPRARLAHPEVSAVAVPSVTQYLVQFTTLTRDNRRSRAANMERVTGQKKYVSEKNFLAFDWIAVRH